MVCRLLRDQRPILDWSEMVSVSHTPKRLPGVEHPRLRTLIGRRRLGERSQQWKQQDGRAEESCIHFQSGYMSDPPSVSLCGAPPVARTVYNSHGPCSEGAW